MHMRRAGVRMWFSPKLREIHLGIRWALKETGRRIEILRPGLVGPSRFELLTPTVSRFLPRKFIPTSRVESPCLTTFFESVFLGVVGDGTRNRT